MQLEKVVRIPFPHPYFFKKGVFLQATGLDSILTDVGKFVTEGVSWMGSIADFVMGEPFVLLMAVIIPLSGWAIGGIKRLTRL